MSFLTVDFTSEESILNGFDRIAEKFARDIQLKINNALYRIVDFEFYTFSKNLQDPHTYKHPLQLQTGKLYLHASGIDITFGNDNNYGGILLRSVVKVHDKTDSHKNFRKLQITGPQNVATELFSNLQILNSDISNEIALIDVANCNEVRTTSTAKPFLKTKRIGLTYKKDDPTNKYRQVGYRYVILVPADSSFKQKIPGLENIVKDMLAANEIMHEETKLILSYTLKIKST